MREFDDNAVDESGGETDRRAMLAALLAGGAILGVSGAAAQSTDSSIAATPLALLLNLHYVSVNYTQLGFYGDGRTVAIDLIRSGKSADVVGVPVTRTNGIRAVSFPTVPTRLRVQEITEELFNRLRAIRGLLRADAPAQKQIDISPTAFTNLMRQAGAIGAAATFDPYENEDNYLIGLFILLDIYPSVAAGLASGFTEDVARAWLGGFAQAAGNTSANIRALLGQRVLVKPELRRLVDAISDWRDRVDGSTDLDQPLTNPTGTPGNNLAQLDADGLFPARSGAQALNIMFMSAGAVTSGGFFPTGVFGTINTSAAG